jgi:cell division transport system permease protein
MASLRSRRTLRPVGFDELGLRRAISDRMLPFLVAAMAFLAALALAGWVGAAS